MKEIYFAVEEKYEFEYRSKSKICEQIHLGIDAETLKNSFYIEQSSTMRKTFDLNLDERY